MATEELLRALGDFDLVGRQIVEAFQQGLDGREVPETIYHYTNDVGLRSILKSGQLWLSDIFALNDPSELRHGLSFAVDALLAKSEQGDESTRAFAKHFSTFADTALRDTAHYFVCSFSTNGDDLGQWRAYADDGRGFALGFDAHELIKLFAAQSQQYQLDPGTFFIAYDDARLDKVHNQLVDTILPFIPKPIQIGATEQESARFWAGLSMSFSSCAIECALLCKHKAYEHESEFRFLQLFRADIPAPDMEWRHRAYELVKYRPFTWRTGEVAGLLKDVMIGPAADQMKAERFAKDCLAAYQGGHIGDVTINKSKIPYRSVG